ncbi:MAG: alpha-L-arabinofuranosidase, partial [Acidobacteria bacterium]|nr:alpha-L-arabinofuranosidase [Acidobacteriota bacterium]
MTLHRRQFLKNSSLTLAAAALLPRPALRAAASFDARVEVLLNEPLGLISPEIYGHFTENLGGVVYDGIWVGPDSKIPNTHGIRKTLTDALQKIKSPVIRWPGGCFADSYDWKDGIGPAAKRPRRSNLWGSYSILKDQGNIPQKYDPNQFGTNEFIEFCRLAGSQPYLAANVRSLPALDFYQWVEYCNSPAGSTTLADIRAAGGSKEPFNVRFWGVGNESWGCGGDMTATEYSVEFRKFVAEVPQFGTDLSFIASGPNDDQYKWTREFLQGMLQKGPNGLRNVWGLSLHYYSWNLSRGRTTDWDAGKGDAVNFEPIDWYELMREGDKLDRYIQGHWQVLNEFDPKKRVKLVVDEWGPWYKPGSEVVPTHLLGQMITQRDAVMSAATLDIFNRHPDKVAMANCAQLINNLNCLFLADGDKFLMTPVYHVFQMYAAHQGAQSIRAEFISPEITYDRDGQTAS